VAHHQVLVWVKTPGKRYDAGSFGGRNQIMSMINGVQVRSAYATSDRFDQNLTGPRGEVI